MEVPGNKKILDVTCGARTIWFDKTIRQLYFVINAERNISTYGQTPEIVRLILIQMCNATLPTFLFRTNHFHLLYLIRHI